MMRNVQVIGKLKEKTDLGAILEVELKGGKITIPVRYSGNIAEEMAKEKEGLTLGVMGVLDQAEDGKLFVEATKVTFLRRMSQ